MTAERLRARTRRDLAGMAKQHAVIGWHAMRKEELIEALLEVLPRRRNGQAAKRRNSNGSPAPRTSRSKRVPATRVAARRTSRAASSRAPSNGKAPASARNGSNRSGQNGKRAQSGIRGTNGSSVHGSNLVRPASRRGLRAVQTNGASQGAPKDRFIAEVYDSHWLRANWSLAQSSISRAEAALGVEWRQSIPIIRVFDVTSNEAEAKSDEWIRDIEIHGEVDNWFVPVENPPSSYRLHIGYRAPSGNFFTLARSNRVTTPRLGSRHRKSRRNGKQTPFQENGRPATRFRLPRGTTQNGGSSRPGTEDFPFEVYADLVVYGATEPNAELTLLGEPVVISEDGSFSLQLELQDGRQVIPAIVTAPNGRERRIVVLGVERNTKELERQDLDERPL